MRDDRHKWAPLASGTVVDLRTATLTPVKLHRQTLISGPDVLRQTELPVVQWPDVIGRESYALSLRRDRVLMVNGAAIATGWDQAKSWAVSNASDAFAVFDLSGADAFDLLTRGAELSLDSPSNSVTRRLFGLDVMLYRAALPDPTYRLHVATAMQDALINHLSSAAAHL